MFNTPAEDDDLFAPPQSSSLAALFASSSSVLGGNMDLTYVAPKQPKPINTPKQKSELAKTQNTVLFAKVVQVYKINNNSNRIIGKYGLALIGDSTQPREIMLYKDKQNILTRATIKQDFQISIENDYVNFRDNNNENWNIQFDEGKYLIEFLDQIKKTKIKISEVRKEKSEESVSSNIPSSNSSTKSDNESEEPSVSQSREEILSRMAKMGQLILPGSIQKTQGDDSDQCSSKNKDIKIENPRELPNYSIIKENPSNSKSSITTQPYMIPSTHSAQVAPYVPIYSSDHLSNPTVMNKIITAPEFSLFVSENRIQNSEIRMNLGTISSKLDSVINEISKIKEPPNTDKLENEFLKSKIIDLERNINETTTKLAQANSTSNSKYLQLEVEIKCKNQEIEREKQKFIELQNTVKTMKDSMNEIHDLKTNEKTLNETLDSLRLQLKESKKAAEENLSAHTKLEEANENLLKTNQDLCEKLKLLEREKIIEKKSESKESNQKVKEFSDIIKDSMNFMFQNIISQLNKDNESYQSGEFKSILSTNIKQTTFSVIQKFQCFLQKPDNSDNSVSDK